MLPRHLLLIVFFFSYTKPNSWVLKLQHIYRIQNHGGSVANIKHTRRKVCLGVRGGELKGAKHLPDLWKVDGVTQRILNDKTVWV